MRALIVVVAALATVSIASTAFAQQKRTARDMINDMKAKYGETFERCQSLAISRGHNLRDDSVEVGARRAIHDVHRGLHHGPAENDASMPGPSRPEPYAIYSRTSRIVHMRARPPAKQPLGAKPVIRSFRPVSNRKPRRSSMAQPVPSNEATIKRLTRMQFARFKVSFPDEDLADLRRRIMATRWPDRERSRTQRKACSSRRCRSSRAIGRRNMTGAKSRRN